MLQDWFTYCIAKVQFGDAANSKDPSISWAGDGGFALVSTTTAGPSADVARSILLAMMDFLELAPLVVGMPRADDKPRPTRPLLRVLMAPISVHNAGRISNAAGPELNKFMKYERELTEVDAITVDLKTLKLLNADVRADGPHRVVLAPNRALHFRPISIKDGKLHTWVRANNLAFLLAKVRGSRGTATFHDKMENVLEKEIRWLQRALPPLDKASDADRAFSSLEPCTPEARATLEKWCMSVVQFLFECWSDSPLGSTGVRLSYFRRACSGQSRFDLLLRCGKWDDSEITHDGFSIPSGRPQTARDAALRWQRPVVIGDVAAENALWGNNETRTATGRIRAHVSLPIEAENSLVVGLLCVDFACAALPHSVCATRGVDDAEQSSSVEAAQRDADADPIFQQLCAFGNELRYGELEARYRRMLELRSAAVQ